MGHAPGGGHTYKCAAATLTVAARGARSPRELAGRTARGGGPLCDHGPMAEHDAGAQSAGATEGVSEPEIEVYRSARRRGCDERAFVLAAVGIPSQVVPFQGRFLLQVATRDAARAVAHLDAYDRENPLLRSEAQSLAPRLFPHAWVGCVGYAAWLLGVPYAISNGLVRLDAFNRGEMSGAAVRAGQWWRAWTALTLHLSGAHLAGNLLVGLWFGYLAGRQFGVGTAWGLIVLGGGLANLLEGLMGPPGYRSAGASTAVFTALGMMAAHTGWTRRGTRQSWLREWIPLGAGVMLLGWLGSGGRHTDTLAHVLGFSFGVLLGWGAAWPCIDRRLERVPQWLPGLAAMLLMALAWARALA
jgi:rhomboid protease GluP